MVDMPKCKKCKKNDNVIKDGFPMHYCKSCKKYFTVHKKPTKSERIILAFLENLLVGSSLGELQVKDLTEPSKKISDDFAYIESIQVIGNLDRQEEKLEKISIDNAILLYKSGEKIEVIRNPQKYAKLGFKNLGLKFSR